MDSNVYTNIFFQIIKAIPWWIWILFAIGIFGYFTKLIRSIGAFRSDEKASSNREEFNPDNYEIRQTMMNSSERVFFETLRRAIGDIFDIYPQVNLDKIFKTKFQSSRTKYNIEKSRIDRKSVDYLLVNRETQSPKIAIELDGSSHERQDRIERDEKVGNIFDHNGIPLIRFSVGDSFTEEELRKKFERYF